MTVPAAHSASCPNCGAPVRFRWAQAVQTTCEYCKSVLVRTGLDLARVGTQAEFPATGSPIQLGTEGRWRQQSFVVVGRITYQWARGRWNEWHCVLNDGASAWLSDAQLEYAMSRPDAFSGGAPDLMRVQVGETFYWHDVGYTVAGIADAQYIGTEGDLPFTTWDRQVCRFIDLHTVDGRFATIDGTERPPLLFGGEYLSFDDLALRNLREFDGWGPAR
jgi:hypothetical protein